MLSCISKLLSLLMSTPDLKIISRLDAWLPLKECFGRRENIDGERLCLIRLEFSTLENHSRSWACFKHKSVFWTRKLSATAHLEEIMHNDIKFTAANRKHGILCWVIKRDKCKTMPPLGIIAMRVHHVLWAYKRGKSKLSLLLVLKECKNERNYCINCHGCLWQNVVKNGLTFLSAKQLELCSEEHTSPAPKR